MDAKSLKTLSSLKACHEAMDWFRPQPDVLTAWRDCQRGDWMLWLLGKLSGEPGSDARRPLVLCVCECARLALPYVRGETRTLKAIETVERWARREEGISLGDVRAATATAATVTAATATAATAATAAATAATAAAYAAADARSQTLSRCADIVRRHYPEPPYTERGGRGLAP